MKVTLHEDHSVSVRVYPPDCGHLESPLDFLERALSARRLEMERWRLDAEAKRDVSYAEHLVGMIALVQTAETQVRRRNRWSPDYEGR